MSEEGERKRSWAREWRRELVIVSILAVGVLLGLAFGPIQPQNPPAMLVAGQSLVLSSPYFKAPDGLASYGSTVNFSIGPEHDPLGFSTFSTGQCYLVGHLEANQTFFVTLQGNGGFWQTAPLGAFQYVDVAPNLGVGASNVPLTTGVYSLTIWSYHIGTVVVAVSPLAVGGCGA
jgi:hypothetical protein